MKNWFKSGAPWIWINASAVSINLLAVFGLLALIAVRGLGYFWPGDVAVLEYKTKQGQVQKLIGEFWETEQVKAEVLRSNGFDIPNDMLQVTRHVLKVGNRDAYGADFQVILQANILKQEYPKDVLVVVRREWGNLYGYLQTISQAGQTVTTRPQQAWQEFAPRMRRAIDLYDAIKQIEKKQLGTINAKLEKIRLQSRRDELEQRMTADKQHAYDEQRGRLEQERAGFESRLSELHEQINRDSFSVTIQDGRSLTIPFSKVVKAYRPNELGVLDKLGMYLANVWEFISDDPREANTEGGVFPAIFGTVMMVLIMAILVTPLGVIAAVYLREYAKQGALTRTIRIAVNNLAGVPSIVYGVFGLGFFVYIVGGNIDRWLFPEAAPAPVFGTPGILWSSLTLAILTLPVVIVATEEGLSRIPRSIREGSLALGATKFETLWRTVIPMASPAIMTGLILAVARAAGEVAPLMLVGVVKLAPSLPLDTTAPFLHLDRKFMHLGFHIYDVGFQSPNVEAARPLVYATSLLLVVVILFLNLAAIRIRNHLREKYRALEG
ncbi:MAG: phosphate ABC transporter permease PstA [Gammaproteobacteria bacterium]|nr:phosphate ABC transporter permease PstA [Gammaproteobacteria bacterium]